MQERKKKREENLVEEKQVEETKETAEKKSASEGKFSEAESVSLGNFSEAVSELKARTDSIIRQLEEQSVVPGGPVIDTASITDSQLKKLEGKKEQLTALMGTLPPHMASEVAALIDVISGCGAAISGVKGVTSVEVAQEQQAVGSENEAPAAKENTGAVRAFSGERDEVVKLHDVDGEAKVDLDAYFAMLGMSVPAKEMLQDQPKEAVLLSPEQAILPPEQREQIVAAGEAKVDMAVYDVVLGDRRSTSTNETATIVSSGSAAKKESETQENGATFVAKSRVIGDAVASYVRSEGANTRVA